MLFAESRVECEGRYEHISLRPPSINLLAAHLQLVALLDNTFINPDDLKALVSLVDCDIRKALLTVQFWVESGGGIKRKFEGLTTAVKQSSNRRNQRSTSTGSGQRERAAIDNSVSSSVLEEESVFLSLSDWREIKNKNLSPTKQSTCQGLKLNVNAECSTDSTFEASEISDSQPTTDGELVECPEVQEFLLESTQGLLNCVTDHRRSCLSVLREKEHCNAAEKVREFFILGKLKVMTCTLSDSCWISRVIGELKRNSRGRRRQRRQNNKTNYTRQKAHVNM